MIFYALKNNNQNSDQSDETVEEGGRSDFEFEETKDIFPLDKSESNLSFKVTNDYKKKKMDSKFKQMKFDPNEPKNFITRDKLIVKG